MIEESLPPPQHADEHVLADDAWITLTVTDPDPPASTQAWPAPAPSVSSGTRPIAATRERLRPAVIALATLVLLGGGAGVAFAASGSHGGGALGAPATTTPHSQTVTAPPTSVATTPAPPPSTTTAPPAPTTAATVTIPPTAPPTVPPTITTPAPRTTAPPPPTTRPPTTVTRPPTTPPPPPPRPTPLTRAQLGNATIVARDFPRAVVTAGGRITAPCSEAEALAKAPVTAEGSEAELGSIVFGSQPGSFATESEANAFVAAVRGTKLCTFTHPNGIRESVTNVESVPSPYPGVSSVRVIYTLDVGGVGYVGLDAYLAIGKVVGVMSCAAPRQNLADLDTWCSSYGATFGGKLGSVYDAYG